MVPTFKKPDNLYQKIYTYLKTQILRNELKAGETVNETKLAEAFETSRSPVRDALKMLESEGYLVQAGNSKVVSGFNWNDIDNLVEIRESLELMVFDLAIKNLDSEDLNNLETIINEMKKTDESDIYGLIILDIKFHNYFVKVSENNLLNNLLSSFYDNLIRATMLSVFRSNWNKDTNINYHSDILALLREKKYDEARQKLKNHIEIWENSINEAKLKLNHTETNKIN